MGKLLKKRGVFMISGIFILLLAIFLRIYNLNELPIFGDEAIYIRWAQIMRNEPALRFIPLSDGKQPLFMWVVIISQKFIKDPLIAGRLVSLFAGLVTMVGIFSSTLVLFSSKSKAGKKDGISFPAYLRSIFSPDNKKVLGVAIIASFVYAISPYTVFFDRMALVDSMLCMFGVWTFVFSLIAFKFLRLDCAMLAGFSLGGAYLTKSPALFFLISLPSNWILAKWPKKDRKKIIKFIKLSALTIVIAAMGLAMFNLLRLGPNFHLLSRRNLDYVHPISRFLEYPFDPMFVFLKKIFGYFWFLGPGSIIVAYIVSLISGIKRNFKQYLVLSAWSILPMIAVSEFSKTMTARYVLFTLPYIIIISASGFLSDSKFIKKIMPVLIVVFSIQSLWINRLLLVDVSAAPLPQGERAGYLEEWTSGTGIKDVSEYFKAYQDNNPEEKIVVGTEGYFGTLPDGLQAYLYDYPQITVIGIGTRIRQLPKDLYESKVYGNKTFLVINNSRLITDHNKLKLKLISSYPKALRAEWTNEYKSLGPQEVLYMFEVTNDTVRIYEDMIKNEKN